MCVSSDGPAVFQIKSFRQSYLISVKSPKEKEEWMQTLHSTKEALYQRYTFSILTRCYYLCINLLFPPPPKVKAHIKSWHVANAYESQLLWDTSVHSAFILHWEKEEMINSKLHLYNILCCVTTMWSVGGGAFFFTFSLCQRCWRSWATVLLGQRLERAVYGRWGALAKERPNIQRRSVIQTTG